MITDPLVFANSITQPQHVNVWTHAALYTRQTQDWNAVSVHVGITHVRSLIHFVDAAVANAEDLSNRHLRLCRRCVRNVVARILFTTAIRLNALNVIHTVTLPMHVK